MQRYISVGMVQQWRKIISCDVFAGNAVRSLSFCLCVSAAMSALFACEDPSTWRSVYNKYWDVVKIKEARGKKPGKLLSLDKW